MTEHRQNPNIRGEPSGVNPGYAVFQIAQALKTIAEHSETAEFEDAETRERARAKIAKWETVLQNILTGAVEYGSRTPVAQAPEWATLEVVTGGFATGELVAGGPLQAHEIAFLKSLPSTPDGEERRALNAFFLSDAGLAWLQERLQSGCYDLAVPEEGALMVVAWLAGNGYAGQARQLIETLAPYFPRLRFYPLALDKPRQFGSCVHLQDVASTVADIRKIKPNHRILAQKEAVEVWAPLHDRIVALFLETVEDDWPCQKYPDGWADRALALLDERAALRKKHRLCARPERANKHHAQIAAFLGRCATNPEALTGREVGRIRLILKRYVEKRGLAGSPSCVDARQRQMADVSAPLWYEIAQIVLDRLERHRGEDGLDDVSDLQQAVTAQEAARTGVRQNTPIPPPIRFKVERCLNETVQVLIERGLITSGETLARVLPQMTAGIRAAGITDPALGRLDAAIYRAFRRRRSLLLLNLEKQVQIKELPWVAAIDHLRSKSLSSRDLARQTLEQVAAVTLTSFPHVIVPNKLLQELRTLAQAAGLHIPLVDELAADIFMGRFSPKFVEAAWMAADLLAWSLYATYYNVDYGKIRQLPRPEAPARRAWYQRQTQPEPDALAQLCASRAGVSLETWEPATNGMIVEQQQILTTQNLAALFAGLDLLPALRPQLDALSRQCFGWICRRLQVKTTRWHARLIALKNAAYAWRQMVFYLALLPDGDVADFLRWAGEHLDAQPGEFTNRFRPALKGLALAADGRSPDSTPDARRFLGWDKSKHWLLAGLEDKT